MANTMATMQGCCCATTIDNCDEAEVWWDSLNECALTGLSFTATACTTCADLDGSYVLDKANPDPSPCTLAGPPMNYEFPSVVPICFSGSIYDWTGLSLAYSCVFDDGIQYVRLTLALAHEYFVGSSGCRAIAERSIALPATPADLESGSLSFVAATPTASDCIISGTVGYSLS